jgi:methylamine--corrinoid protein Co-methyltransferase
MITIIDIQKRAAEGPLLKERQFDLKFAKKVRELVKDYSIAYHPEEIIPGEETADKVFKAGVDLLHDVGFYHTGTNRIVEFTKEEIEEAINTRPKEIIVGEGFDAVTMRKRAPEDENVPTLFPGPVGTPLTEDLFIPVMQSVAQEPTTEGVCPGSLASVGGIHSVVGTPNEILVAMTEPQWWREALRRAGRPNLFTCVVLTPVSPAAVISSFYPEGYRKGTTGVAVYVWSEMKVEWAHLILGYYAAQSGILTYLGVMPMIGALCRGPEDAAVAAIAETLGLAIFSNSPITVTSPFNTEAILTTRECLWAESAANLAAGRNWQQLLWTNYVVVAAGPCTKQALYEIAAETLASGVSGADGLAGCGAAKIKATNCATGLEARMMGETAMAVAGMKRDKANAILNKLIPKYEDNLSEGTIAEGKSFSECYDVKTVMPSQEYLDVLAEVKTELSKLGISYKQ